jgi:hypothetical protein
MNKDKLNDLNSIDIMSFLSSMQNMQSMQSMQKVSKPKKNKKSTRCTIKEEDNVYIKECTEEGCEDGEECEAGAKVSDKTLKGNGAIKNVENIKEEDDEDEDDEDEDDDEDDEDDEDDDEDDEDEEDDEDDDEEDDEEDCDVGMSSEDLYNIFNNFFADEYGVSIATSLSNIAFELNKLNKNLKSKK